MRLVDRNESFLRLARRGAAALGALLMALLANGLIAPAPARAAGAGDQKSQASVTSAYLSLLRGSRITPGWTGSAATCKAGHISPTYVNTMVSNINLVRSWMGLRPVSLDSAANNARVQRRALMAQANNDLSHFFTSSQKCAAGTALSPIKGWEVADGEATNAVFDWLGDVNNLSFADGPGHRTNLLEPGATKVAIGATTDYAYLDTTGFNWSATGTYAYPSAGYFPYEMMPSSYFGNGQMQWIYYSTNLDFRKASLSVKWAGRVVPLKNVVKQDGKIFWQPSSAISQPGQGTSTDYTVTISGAETDTGKTAATISYTVKLYSIPQMYRLYNWHTGEHFYTESLAERNHLQQAGWLFEGVGWYPASTGAPVYRIYNPHAPGGDHYYTMSHGEAAARVKQGWLWDNGGHPVFYSGGVAKVYVAYNPNAKSGAHNYTTSLAEQQHLLRLGWKYGTVAWKALG